MVYLYQLIVHTCIPFPSSLPRVLFKDFVGGGPTLLGNSTTAGERKGLIKKGDLGSNPDFVTYLTGFLGKLQNLSKPPP